MARTPRLRPLTGKMAAVLAVLPNDGAPVDQGEIYRRVGQAEGIGAILWALEQRGLVKEDRVKPTPWKSPQDGGNPRGRTWQWRKVMNR